MTEENDYTWDCPNCGATQIETHLEPEAVHWINTIFHLQVPVRTCLACSFRWTDCEREDMVEAAIKNYQAGLQIEITQPPYFEDDQVCGYCHRVPGTKHEMWCRQ